MSLTLLAPDIQEAILFLPPTDGGCGPWPGLVKELRAVQVTGRLAVTLLPPMGTGKHPPVLSGVEVMAEGW